MSHEARYRFKDGYLLKEEHLRELDKRISKIASDFQISHTYSLKLHRDDGLSYTLNDIEELIGELKSKSSQIKGIEVWQQDGAGTHFLLVFDESGAFLGIQANDRNYLKIVNDETKTYVEENIMKSKPNNAVENVNFILALPILVIALVYYISFWLFQGSALYTFANFLHDSSMFLYYCIFCVCLGIFRYLGIINAIANYFFPRNKFLFGEELNKYNAIIDCRSKIVWGIVVNFTLGAIIAITIN